MKIRQEIIGMRRLYEKKDRGVIPLPGETIQFFHVFLSAE